MHLEDDIDQAEKDWETYQISVQFNVSFQFRNMFYLIATEGQPTSFIQGKLIYVSTQCNFCTVCKFCQQNS